MKPIQIAVTHQKSENEQWGVEILYVLLDNGRIFRIDSAGGPGSQWTEVGAGPWENK